MKIFTSFIALLSLGYSLVFSQVQTIPLSVDKSGYLENEELAGTPPEEGTSTEVVPTIKGELNVNSQGALTYNVPIEVFKGVNEFQPNLALAYSSDGGNGQAGYGWNIVGLSTITRGGKSRQIDGVYEGPQFDESDPYYLDGQRLIGFNEESPNTAVTEIYSTIKISKINEGNYVLRVQYPDGKIAKYVNLAPHQYTIGLMIDAYGNEIEYNYATEDNTSYLESISYGKTTGAHPFTISFERKQKNQSIRIYRNGLEYVNRQVLSSVSVSSTQEGLYRKYILTHDISSLGQERLRRIDVENSVRGHLKSLNFNYDDVDNYDINQNSKSNSGITNSTKEFGNVTMGDFEGDGNISAIYILKEEGEGNRLVSSKKGLLSIEGNNYNPQLYTGKIIKSDGKVSERDQLLSVSESFDGYITINGNYFISQEITFSFKDLKTNEVNSTSIHLPQGYKEDTNGWCDEHYGDLEFRVGRDLNPRDFITGDFNSDGLIDVIIHQFAQKGSSVENPVGTYCEGYSPLSGNTETKVYFLEIGKLVSSGTETSNLSQFEYTRNDLTNNKHYLVEFNGDGIPEILQLNKTSHKFDIIKINHKNKSFDTVLSQYELSDFTSKTPLVIGDYNGDGLTDFLTPKKVYELTQDNNMPTLIRQLETGSSYIWHQYISDGITFNHSERDFTAQKLSYLTPSSKNYVRASGSFWQLLWSLQFEYDRSDYGAGYLIPIDFNNDGKTDLVSFKKFGTVVFQDRLKDTQINNFSISIGTGEYYPHTHDQGCYEEDNYGNPMGSPICGEPTGEIMMSPEAVNRLVVYENIYDENNEFSLDVHTESEQTNIARKKISPFSFFINSQQSKGLETYTTKLVLHDPQQGKDHIFSINSNKFFENRINQVDNSSGVVQQIEYTPLQKNVSCSSCSGDDSDNCNYLYDTESLDLPYPYYIHKQVPLKFMVSKVNTLFDEHTITKEYRYENAVQHLDGKGFLGFAKTYISDPYESKFVNNTYLPKNLQEPVFWKINKYDPLLENQLVETRYGELGGDYFTKSQMSYTKYMSSNAPNSNLAEHQYIYLSHQESNQDRTKNISTSKTYSYDESGDLLLLSSVTDYNGEGTSTTEIAYESPWSVGEHYFNGRILSHTETTNAYGSTFTTRDEYSDFNDAGIALTHDKSGNNTSEITTELTFDTFGNLSSERVSADGIASLTTTFSYDDSHRFVTSITNPEGQTATKTVDIHGRPLLETSAIDSNIKTHHTYDDWGNPLTSTTFYQTEIAQTTTLLKENIGNGYYTLTTTTPGTPQTIVTFDKFDRQIKAKTQSINGKWSVVDTEYDIFGKKTKVSEPYFDNESPTLWNTIAYDALDRPVEQVLYTGKVITTCYNGMTVTVDDGDQKTSKTLDVFGNVVQHKDYGGTINYDYFPNGTLKEADYDGVVIKIEQDGWGNKTRLEDPSAGVYEYSYDALGRKLSEISPKDSTVYTYDDYGKLLYEVREGENTHLFLQYEYNPSTKLPTKIYGSNGTDNFVYETKYDDYHRIEGKIETTPFFTYETTIALDDLGRPETFSTATTLAANAQTVTTQVRNFYDVNGLQTKLIDPDTGGILWELDQVNAKGQTTQMHWGNGYQINHGYDNFYMPQSIAHSRNNQTALSIDYQFDAQKGVLLSRNNYIFDKQENFEYDALYRLTREILNGSTLNEYGYDQRGRITYNSGLGEYSYNNTDYQIQKIGFNQQGQNLADNRGFHEIVYNGYKKAVSIHLEGKERLDFEYNPFGDRVAMYYGSEAENLDQRPLRRYYSSDKAVEITHNLQTGTIEVLTYLDGDPYSANVVERKLFSGSTGTSSERWYLHRDYQATILAISNSAGAILEQRYFDAWGNLKEYRDATGTLFVVTDEANINLILDRGYTGHEHLWGVDLIHMNGRLYDAQMRRFLSPDNFVQDPYNTQNFNRYTYVLNNPLLYTDSSGEYADIGVWGAIGIAVAVAVTTKVIVNLANGQKWWYGLGKSAVIGAVSGAISFGIGSVATSASSTFVGQAAFQAGAHGMSGGYMSLLEGESFGSGFVSSAVSSLVSSGVQALGIDFSKTKTINGKRIFALNKFGKSDLFKVLQIGASGLSGGLSSTIAGGSFSQGITNGLISGGVNSIADIFLKKGSGIRIPKGKASSYLLSVYDLERNLVARGESNEESQINLQGRDFDRSSKLISGLGLSTNLKTEIINYVTKGGTENIGKFGQNYLKSFKLLGKVTGVGSAYLSWMDYNQNPTTGNLIQAIGSTVLVPMKLNPIMTIGIGILDVTGGSDYIYDSLGDFIDNN